jgi:hypothetical protein
MSGDVMRDAFRGMLAGLAGTSAMTATMLADRAWGGMRGELPPRSVGREAEEAVGLRRELSQPAFEASWVAQHFAYGAAAGAVYELGWRRMTLPEPIPSGLTYGAALWVIGYAGWLPALDLYPPPQDEPPRRVAGMIAHHLVFGATLALASAYLRPRGRAGR